MWDVILDWFLTVLGILWVRRTSKRKMWCTIYSAGAAASLFLCLEAGLLYGVHSLAPILAEEPRIIHLLLMFSIIPASSALTLFLGCLFIPFFGVGRENLLRCTLYLTGWVYFGAVLEYLIKQWAFLLLAGASGSGMPNIRSKWFDGEIRY